LPPEVAGEARTAPPAVIERLETLLRRADAARRDGKPEVAAALYAEIADHQDGAPFAEEALFRKAELFARLGRVQDSLQALGEAERRFGRGELAPERSALAARIHLDQDDAVAAGRALSSVRPGHATLEVSMVAIDVALALEEEHPCDALRLSSLVHAPKELRARAADLGRRIGSRCPRSP
jgi:hypothetical protein